MTVPGPSPLDASPGCPPPLQWQDVLREFFREAQPWFLERPGHRVTGRTWGQGRPLYLLPGFTGTLDLFALLAYLLKDDFRCVLLDYPGSLSGPLPPGKPSLPVLADDLIAVADQCGDPKFDLFACSFGTLVATQAMLDRPDRVRSAVLEGALAFRNLTRAERMLGGMCRRLPGRLRHLPARRIVQQQNHRPWFPPFDATRFQFLLENTGQVRLSALGWRAAVVAATDLRPRLGELQQPLLFLQGEGEGPIAEECLSEFAAGCRSERAERRIERLSNTGQLAFLTHPHRVAKLVREFLQCPDP